MAGKDDDDDFVELDPKKGAGAAKEDEFKDTGVGGEDEDDDDVDVVIAGEDEGGSGEGEGEKKSAKSDDERDRFKSRSEERRLKNKRKGRHFRRDDHVNRRLQQENNDLKRRLDAVEGKLESSVSELKDGTIDQQLNEAKTIYGRAKAAHAKAVADGDGERAAEAMEAMIEARGAISDFENYKRTASSRRENGDGRRSAAPGMDPEVESRFNAWHRDNPWYDRKIGDRESRIAYSLDNVLVAEGFDPRTDEYWEELDARLREHPKLAHLYEDDDNDDDEDDEMEDDRRSARRREASPPPRKKPNPPSGRTPQNNNTKRKIVVSRERAEAMREMGLEPGTKEWNSMAKKYADYDRQNTNR